MGATAITVESALAWATQPQGASPFWWSVRLGAARLFARYMSNLDPATEVPPPDLLPTGRLRATPFIYTPHEIATLMDAAEGSSSVPLVAANYRTLIGLLTVTGMRVGEAISLDRDDLDTGDGLLVVRQGKFGKSR